jgi:hypothetical protein
VKANRSSLKLGNCSKLVARYCGTFEILERIVTVAYMLALPASMSIHNVFHVSFLKKYIPDANHVIDWNVIQVEQEGAFQVHPGVHTGSEDQEAPESSHRASKGPMDLVRS